MPLPYCRGFLFLALTIVVVAVFAFVPEHDAISPGRGDASDAVVRDVRVASGGYTTGMKTAVSIPDEIFEKVEKLAKRERKSRSEVFSAALREYVARHAPDEITESINQVCDRIGDQDDRFVRTAARRILEKTEW